MMGDALSHAVLLGVVIAFLATGSTHFLVFLVGALLAAIMATGLMEFIEKKLHVESEAAMALIFTSFFALGVILIQLFTEKVDLDQGCVLYGQLITAIFDKWAPLKGVWLPKAAIFLGGLLLVNGLLIATLYRPLVIMSFDPAMAASIGMHTKAWDYLLILLTSATAVFSLKIVGAPLVISFLILPPATAYLLTYDLKTLIAYTFAINFGSTLLGYMLAALLNTSVPGAMATSAGLFFGAALALQSLRLRAQRA